MGDIDTIEKVQKRAARIPFEFRNLSYEKRLEEWELTKLSDRRLRGDLIQMYKILKNLDEISWVRDPRENLSKNTYEKRENVGNDLSLVRERFSARNSNDHCHFVDVRHKFFSNRVTEHWNKLPNNVVNAPSLDSFKASLDAFHGLRLL